VTTLHESLSYTPMFTVTLSTTLMGNVFRKWTFLCSWAHVLADCRPSHTNPTLLTPHLKTVCSQSRSYVTTEGRSASLSGYLVLIWGPRSDSYYCHTVAKLGGSLSPQNGAPSGCGWRNGLQLWRVAANILNKQPRTNDKGWSSSLGVWRGAINPSS
jgi:hypothetical protein